MTVTVALPIVGVEVAWRDAARRLVRHGVEPGRVIWRSAADGADLFSVRALSLLPVVESSAFNVPAAFPELATNVVCHSDPERFARLYAMLWRLQTEKRLLDDPSDRDVAALRAMEKSVRRDSHKMKAFVRFRDLAPEESGRRRFGAWFEPEHHTLERTAPFFARRFGDMDWVIATPAVTATFEQGELSFKTTAIRPDFGTDDADILWRTYFANIFNPARLKVAAMKSEMPKKYWKNLPEAELIPGLIASSQMRARHMQARAPTLAPIRAEKAKAMAKTEGKIVLEAQSMPPTLAEAREQASVCTRCPLYRDATQTVFGEGPDGAELMFVGEQPGDMEDLAGKPFVGPAGKLFDEAIEAAGIERAKCYVTYAVKHFKFTPRGKRRIHQKPNAGEVQHCKFWLDLERQFVRPKLIVALGATAALSLTGDGTSIMKRRGTIERLEDGTPVFLTIHPSMILRIPDARAAEQAKEDFRRDLEAANTHLKALAA